MPPKKTKVKGQQSIFGFLERVNDQCSVAEDVTSDITESDSENVEPTSVSTLPLKTVTDSMKITSESTLSSKTVTYSMKVTSSESSLPLKTVTDSMKVTSSSGIKALSTNEALKLLEEYFPEEMEKKNLHCYYTCEGGVCSGIEGELTDRKGKMKDRFLHKWLTDRDTSFSEETGMWWLLAVKGKGMYCLLCRIHNITNKFNKLNTFNISPSTNYKHSAVKDHAKTQGHTEASKRELYRRDSSLAQQHEQVRETKDQVTANAFLSCYWLGKEEVANRKLKSLINLEKEIGAKEMGNFKHLGEGSQKDMRILLGQLIKNQLISKVKTAKWFSVSVDEVTDCSTLEQLLIFLGYVNEQGMPHFQFLEVKDVLEHSDSPDAETITQTILDELTACGFDLSNLCGFGSDGASVMTGSKNGVGTKLQSRSPIMLRSHCINHRLALACGDANDKVGYIAKAETILRQLWSWLEYPKRCSAFVKTVKNYRNINIPENSKGEKLSNRLAVKVQKACRTRWLSTGQSVSSICKNLVPIILTLRQFKETDATAHGLITRMNNCQFIGTMLLLNIILPQLNRLSKLFQKDHTCYLSIRPALDSTKSHLAEVRASVDLVKELETALNGQYAELELSLTEGDPIRMFLSNLVRNYTEALEKNLDRRFSAAAPVFESFSIFDPTCLPKTEDSEFKDYGTDKIMILCDQFRFEEEETLAQWANFKYQLASWKIPVSILKGESKVSPTEYVLKKIVKEQASHRINFRYLVDAAQICLTQPLSNAVVERGASAVKRVKTRLRSRMKNVMLSSLLQISINGPPLQTEGCKELVAEAAKVWRRTHVRNLPPLNNLPKVGNYQHTDSLVHERLTVDCGVQAGPEDLEPSAAVQILDSDVPAESILDAAVQVAADSQAGEEEQVQNVLKEMDMGNSDSSDPDSEFEFDFDMPTASRE